ncbi:MAG: hypothetical protein HY544_01950 [Candidatus Diapherotrites archaeon]|uniref:Uncharacterized protein n=1 Tax=Candidatus Iainarchaeum sp. TaxID=3101447 RepID=A0A8T3YQ08_9ARCH|nr:hypothetical protein [Candidatus Diapherotrites archaeon]
MGKDETYKGLLAYIVGALIEDGKKAKTEYGLAKGGKDKLFQGGRALAYYEVLSTVKNRIEAFGIRPSEVDFGMDPGKLLDWKTKTGPRKKQIQR